MREREKYDNQEVQSRLSTRTVHLYLLQGLIGTRSMYAYYNSKPVADLVCVFKVSAEISIQVGTYQLIRGKKGIE